MKCIFYNGKTPFTVRCIFEPRWGTQTKRLNERASLAKQPSALMWVSELAARYHLWANLLKQMACRHHCSGLSVIRQKQNNERVTSWRLAPHRALRKTIGGMHQQRRSFETYVCFI